MPLNFQEIVSVTLVLFSVIDIVGNIPVIISLRKKAGHIQSEKATLVSAVLMIAFLFVGEQILSLFGVDISSFAITGSLVIFLIGLEMILGLEIFKSSPEVSQSTSIVPLAFPLIAGAGSLTTVLSLRSEFEEINIIIGILINMVIVYIVLKSSGYLSRKIGSNGLEVLRRVFGIILISIAIKIFKNQWVNW